MEGFQFFIRARGGIFLRTWGFWQGYDQVWIKGHLWFWNLAGIGLIKELNIFKVYFCLGFGIFTSENWCFAINDEWIYQNCKFLSSCNELYGVRILEMEFNQWSRVWRFFEQYYCWCSFFDHDNSSSRGSGFIITECDECVIEKKSLVPNFIWPDYLYS